MPHHTPLMSSLTVLEPSCSDSRRTPDREELLEQMRSIQVAVTTLIEHVERMETVAPLVRPPRDAASEDPGLTAREVEVLSLVGAGLANRGIASRLGIAEKTVKAHISSIFTKLKARSRSQAVLAAARLGVLANVT